MSDNEAKNAAENADVASPVQDIVINRYVYHYCAQHQETIGSIAFIDGIAQMKNPITSMADYHDLKKAIDAPNAENLTIKSLSFLGMEQGL